VSAKVIPFRWGPVSEPWVSKAQVAAHFGRSKRWVELMARKGLPSRMIGGRRAYRLSEVDAWLAETFG
jgi:predicted DNA-binding transcriptional regulator AlpA